ncbi:protealysin inhibitor emfourin [Chitinivorax sp. PXF-14]|uniref:protealysin inhibitor emfourin n=1 Tax=Chitinivorax sp. PXF-14 TaxID=3230488 RepID=UPI0034657BF7
MGSDTDKPCQLALSLAEKGGLAFIPGLNNVVTRLSGDQLDAAGRVALLAAVEAAGLAELPARAPIPGKGADYKTYALDVELNGRQLKVEFNDLTLTPPLAHLLELIRSLAAAHSS